MEIIKTGVVSRRLLIRSLERCCRSSRTELLRRCRCVYRPSGRFPQRIGWPLTASQQKANTWSLHRQQYVSPRTLPQNLPHVSQTSATCVETRPTFCFLQVQLLPMRHVLTTDSRGLTIGASSAGRMTTVAMTNSTVVMAISGHPRWRVERRDVISWTELDENKERVDSVWQAVTDRRKDNKIHVIKIKVIQIM